VIRLLSALLLIALSAATAAGPTIVATIPPYAMAARAVAGEDAEVHSLIRSGQDPHHFDPAVTDIARLRRADLIVANGIGLRRVEGHLPDDGPVMRVAEATDFEAIRDERGAVNPHIWLDPAVMRRAARALAGRLGELDPGAEAAYRRRAGAFAERVAAAAAEAEDRLAGLPTRQVITQHPGFDYFLRRFGLTLAGTYTDLSGAEPGPRRVRRLLDRIRSAGIPAVFGEPQLPSGPMRTLAAEAGVGYAELDPLGLSGEVRTYPGLLLRIARGIRDAYRS
jgi:ABC-type Zn uptake system ZnuABC Zn-binding protein ZnuA